MKKRRFCLLFIHLHRQAIGVSKCWADMTVLAGEITPCEFAFMGVSTVIST